MITVPKFTAKGADYT